MVALQIRDVPDEIRDELSRAAGARGQSLQALLLEMVTREARLHRNLDIFHSAADLRVELPKPGEPGAPDQIIREARDEGFTVDRG